MIKLLHTADLHLDSPLTTLALRDAVLREKVENATRTALDRIIDIAIDEEVDALLIAGDLYDGTQRSIKTAAFLRTAMARLDSHGIRVFTIRGNHDAESKITGEINWPDNVHVFDGRGGHQMLTDDLAIHGVSFREPHAPESLVPKYRPQPGVKNVALLHTSLSGGAGHDPYAPCTVTDLANAGFDYWALGHIHKRQVHATSPFIVMPGMPQGRDMGEDGAKSVTLIKIDGDHIEIEERATAALTFERITLDVSACSDMDDVQRTLTSHLRNLPNAADIVARITLTGMSPLNWQLRRDHDLLQAIAREIAATIGSVWIDRVDVTTAPVTDQAGSDAASDEMAALIGQIAQAPAILDEVTGVIEDLVKDLPTDLRDAWGVDETTRHEIAQHLLTGAQDWAIAQMHGVARAKDDRS